MIRSLMVALLLMATSTAVPAEMFRQPTTILP